MMRTANRVFQDQNGYSKKVAIENMKKKYKISRQQQFNKGR
jgi:hypothetical protein